MRIASILLALVVVLGFGINDSFAGAWGSAIPTDHEYTVKIAGEYYGFSDGHVEGYEGPEYWAAVHIGQLATHKMPCTAMQGLIGFIVILAALIVLPIVVLVTWRKKRVVERSRIGL